MQDDSNYDVGSSLGCGNRLMNGTRLMKQSIRCLACWNKVEGLVCWACGGIRLHLMEDPPEDYDGSYAGGDWY